MNKPRIFTHKHIDLDALFAVLVAIKYILKENFIDFFKDVDWRTRICFVPANWNGEEMEKGDIAVDLKVNGKGMKGEVDPGERVGSATHQIVETYAPSEDKKALQYLIAFIDGEDASGNAIDEFFNEERNTNQKEIIAEFKRIFRVGSLSGVFRAVQTDKKISNTSEEADRDVIEFFATIFNGMLLNGLIYLNLCKAYKSTVTFHGLNKNIALVKNGCDTLCMMAFENGAEVVVYVSGKDLGIKRKNGSKIPMDHENILAVIESFGELNKWFIHESKFLVCHGSRKNPAKTWSKISPYNLIPAIDKTLSLYI